MELEQKLECIKQWTPPKGVRWEFSPDKASGLIYLTIVCGEFGDIHIVKGFDEVDRIEALEATAKLVAMWDAELKDRTSGGSDPLEAWTRWLNISMRTVHHLQRQYEGASPIAFAQAAWLLASVECGDILPPQISFVSMCSSAIRITWKKKNLMVSIEVRPDRSIEIIYSVDCNVIDRYVHTSNQVEHVRQAVAWIFPQSNCGFPR